MKLFGTYEIKVYVRDYLESLPDLAGKVFIDLPAGTGVMAEVARRRGARVEAYDLFPEFCTVPDLECRKADLAGTLPIEDGHADYVLCQEGIEHLSDQVAALRELNRILRPGGRLILTTPNNSNLRARLSHFFVESDLYNRMPPNEIDSIWFSASSRREFYYGHVFLIGMPKLRVLARIAGFRIDRVHSVKASGTALLLGVTLPLVALVNLWAYAASVRRHRDIDLKRRKEVFGEILRLNLNREVLFGKHLFVDLVKERELDEIGPLFYKKLSASASA